MGNIEALVQAAKNGDIYSFSEIVRLFQDMAYGYAYSILGDFQLAEDAAQEAFIEAYYNLAKLEENRAFPGWFRRIVKFRCHRFLRRKELSKVTLESSSGSISPEPGPFEIVEKKDIAERVLKSINTLSQPLREVTSLFYINGYSHNEISGFLEIPVNTVKSRLNASRKQLKRRMHEMIKETFDINRLPDGFSGSVINNVTKVSYSPQSLNTGGNEMKSPQGVTFLSCLCSCLEKMGEDYGVTRLEHEGKVYYMDNLYMMLMGASGAAFRLVWNPGKWDYGNVGLDMAAEKPMEPFSRAFNAAGYDYEIIGNRDCRHEGDPERDFYERYEGYDFLRESIIKSIKNKNRPVIAFGVVGPPECCIIAGYDKSGEVLIGWSYFQDDPIIGDPGIEFEPSGYFRQREWYRNTPGIIIIGDKKTKPGQDEIYRTALGWAIELSRTEDVHGRKGGLAAYQAWADDLLRDEDFPGDNYRILQDRIISHDDAIYTIAEGRWYASYFLRKMAEAKPELTKDLNRAADIYNNAHELMWQCMNLIGGPGRSEKQVRNLGKPEIRRDLASIIQKAGDREIEAVEILEKVIDRF